LQALEKAKDNRSKSYDQYHRPQPKYTEGDEVLLKVKNIEMSRPTKMLTCKVLGSFAYLPKWAKVPTDSNAKGNSEFTTYSIPYSRTDTRTTP
jgi:hypothetical protein